MRIRVLLVEDNPADARLNTLALERHGFELSQRRVENEEQLLAALGDPWDVILSDNQLPTYDARRALHCVRSSGLDTPFIVISGTLDEAAAVDLMREGASDYLRKDALARLGPAVERELREAEGRKQRLAAEEERARLVEELRVAVRARDEFLSVASHELRTPLTALQLKVESLRRSLARGQLDPVRTEHDISVVLRQVARLRSLIIDLLEVGRVTSGTLTLRRVDVDLCQLTREVATHFEAEAERVSSTLLVDAPGELLGSWDATRLAQLLENLLSNALKYGAGKPVTVRVRRENDVAALEVRDLGIGISVEDQARIFGRFERAVSDRHYGGLGVGLWIAKQVVDAHGGRIQVRSQPGDGSCFRVELPMQAHASAR